MLPAHGEAFRGLHARVDSLLRGQDVAFTRLRRSLQEPKRAVDVFSALFGRAELWLPLLDKARAELVIGLVPDTSQRRSPFTCRPLPRRSRW